MTVGCATDGDVLMLEVSDPGVGIPQADHKVIWEALAQLRNLARNRSKGLGLGLCIVARPSKVIEHSVTAVSRGVRKRPDCSASEGANGSLDGTAAMLTDAARR